MSNKMISLMAKRGLYAVPDISTELDISRSTIYRWIEEGKAEGTKHVHRVFVSAESIKPFVDTELFDLAITALNERYGVTGETAASAKPQKRRRRREAAAQVSE